MSIHWKSLDTPGKIEAVKSVWREGMSAIQIAAHFNGATKGAIIGLYNRHADRLEGTRLRPRAAVIERVERAKRRIRSTGHGTLPCAPVLPDEQHGAGRTLMMLARHQCKWPVNDVEPGGIHLFCGLPADGPYCEHHAFRSIRSALDRGAER